PRRREVSWNPLRGIALCSAILASLAGCEAAALSSEDCLTRAPVLSVAELKSPPRKRIHTIIPDGDPRRRRAVAFGKAHNDGVRDYVRRARRLLTDTTSLEGLVDVLVTAGREYATAQGDSPDSMEITVKVAMLAGFAGKDSVPAVRRVADRLKSNRLVRERFDSTMAYAGRLRANGRVGRHLSGANLNMVMSDSQAFMNAGADMYVSSTDGTVAAADAIQNTDDAADYWLPQINSESAWAEATVAVQELADSSRNIWEEATLDAFIAANGDTTIFNPVYRLSGNRTCAKQPPGTETYGGGGANVIACPQCWAAAAGFVAGDLGAGISNYGNKVAHPVSSVVEQSVVWGVAGYAATWATGSAVATAIETRIGGAVKAIWAWIT
ncbi:MAG: hypothetical protein ABIZ70_14055, partial [Gemmatimonadales bacterium]